MAFSIKQLLFSIAVVAFGLVALFNGQQVVGQLFDVLTLGILIAMAYGAWLSHGQRRAFRIGFLCWAVLYFLLFKKQFEIPIGDLMNRVYFAIQPQPFGDRRSNFGLGLHPNFYSVFNSLLLLLFGVIGGWVTVYFYRTRQRNIASIANEGVA